MCTEPTSKLNSLCERQEDLRIFDKRKGNVSDTKKESLIK